MSSTPHTSGPLHCRHTRGATKRSLECPARGERGGGGGGCGGGGGGCACLSHSNAPPIHQVSHLVSKDRSQSVPAPPTAQPRQSLLPFGGGHFGPLNGLRQLVSPRSSKEEDFAIPLEEVLEELEEAGVASEEGYSTERVLQVGGSGFGVGVATLREWTKPCGNALVLYTPISAF